MSVIELGQRSRFVRLVRFWIPTPSTWVLAREMRSHAFGGVEGTKEEGRGGEFYPPLQVHGFPTPDDLEWLDRRRAGRKPLSIEMIDTGIVERDYQIAAIRTVLEQLEASSE